MSHASLLMFFALTTGLAQQAQANDKQQLKLAQASVRLQQAVDAAEAATGGRAYEAQLEHNRFGLEYEVEVVADGQRLEVSVDAQTAKILGIRPER